MDLWTIISIEAQSGATKMIYSSPVSDPSNLLSIWYVYPNFTGEEAETQKGLRGDFAKLPSQPWAKADLGLEVRFPGPWPLVERNLGARQFFLSKCPTPKFRIKCCPR